MAIIVSIDIGYINLGLVEAYIDEEFNITITKFEKLNLSIHRHTTVPRDECKLCHTREIVDGVMHFIQEYREMLNRCDKILIERQPPAGFTSIEAVLFYEFRHKSIMISPNAMHAFFKINHLDYNDRKIKTTEIAAEYIDVSDIERKHDIADATCMVIFYNHPFKKEYDLNKLPFENFKFTANNGILSSRKLGETFRVY